MSKVEQMIDEVMDFIFVKYGDTAHLRIGIFEDSHPDTPHGFYSAVFDNLSGKQLQGEGSWGCDNVEEALGELVGELSDE